MTEMTVLDVKPLIVVRIFYYDVLRRLFRQEPDLELLSQLSSVMDGELPFEEEYDKLLEGKEGIKTSLENGEPLERIHWDYTRMFIGPYRLPAPIWESAYTNKDGLLFQNETREVRLHYLKYAFLPVQYQKEADDHLGLELDFMYQLSCMTRDKYAEGDTLALMELLTDQETFLREHLRNWLPAFIGLVEESAETSFYKGVVALLEGVTQFDREALQELKDVCLS